MNICRRGNESIHKNINLSLHTHWVEQLKAKMHLNSSKQAQLVTALVLGVTYLVSNRLIVIQHNYSLSIYMEFTHLF